ncbi:MAG: DUF2807 domain-containing protein [Hyphomonadaceae bacterium]
MRLLLASAIIATSAAATFLAVTSSASAETRSYALSGFTKIEAHAGFRIEFTQSPAWSVKVDSRFNNLDKIIVEKVGDTLRISRPEGFCTGISRISKDGPQKQPKIHKEGCLDHEVEDVITISAPDLEALNLSAAISFTAAKLNVDKLSIDGHAAVTVDIDSLQVGNLDVQLEAASKLMVAGACTRVDMNLGAATTVDTKNLKCREAHINAGVASKVEAFASDKAVAKAGISTSIKVSGHPRDFQPSAQDRFGSSVSLAD